MMMYVHSPQYKMSRIQAARITFSFVKTGQKKMWCALFEFSTFYTGGSIHYRRTVHGVQNTDFRTHYCAAGLGRCQKCNECNIEVSTTLTEVFCGFPLFYQANAGVVPIYRPQPITFLHPSTQFYHYPCSCQLGTYGVWA
jgi:hypothetical protein